MKITKTGMSITAKILTTTNWKINLINSQKMTITKTGISIIAKILTTTKAAISK